MAVVMQSPRWLRYRGTTVPEHLTALDNDVDIIDAATQQQQDNHTELLAKLDKLNARMFGVLIALLTAAGGLVANVLVHHG